MKKFAMIAIAAALAVVMAFSFVACNVEVNLNATVSEKDPENIPVTVEINGDMSATEMLAAAIENYYGTDFAIARTTGSLTTEVAGGAITLTQFVKSVTIRDGASDADNKLFYQNLSGTAGGSLPIEIKIYEETDYVKSGDSVNMYFRSANTDSLELKSRKNAQGHIDDAWFEWKGGEADFTATKSYNSLDTYIEERASDPTRIWMYDINENTIIPDKTVEPKLVTDPDNPSLKYYTFSVSGNVNKEDTEHYSVAEYEEQMLYMLASQNQNPKEFRFTEITLNVQVWPSGHLRKVDVVESYFMSIARGLVSTEVTLKSAKAFFFDPNAKPDATVDHGAFDTAQIGSVQASAKA